MLLGSGPGLFHLRNPDVPWQYFWLTKSSCKVWLLRAFSYPLTNYGKNDVAWQGAGKSLMNMLRSHSAAYKALRAMPGSGGVSIGLVHNVFWLEAKGNSLLYFHVK